MKFRIVILTLSFLSASVYIAKASKTEPRLIRESLARVPIQIGKWRGKDIPLDSQVEAVLGVDDYINRFYIAASEHTAVGVYIGFYQTQRQGASIHSPMNCLPGAGWNPVARTYTNISVATSPGSSPDRNILVNRIIIQKGMDKQTVLYWYQSHGRIIANEYWGKIYTVLDAMRLNRTDGALVRIISPTANSTSQAEETAMLAATEFAQSIFPLLSRSLPE